LLVFFCSQLGWRPKTVELGETGIQASFAFNKENKIEQLQLIVELDERSGKFEKVENVQSVLLMRIKGHFVLL